MALRIAPTHTGALKGLAFLYFKVGDLAQAETHLLTAQQAAPDDPTIVQALAVVRGRDTEFPDVSVPATPPPGPPASPPAAPAPAPAPAGAETLLAVPPPALEDTRVFAGLEGSQEGLLLLDPAGRVLGGALRDPQGRDVTDAVAAYLAGVSQESTRTAKLLGLGTWTGLAAEGRLGHVYLTAPSAEALLLVVRDRSVPMGRLAILAQRVAQATRRWLEQSA
jgi:predicted regulator of Ras-like GTPase activity (Roadblock/LC7/MglB family)